MGIACSNASARTTRSVVSRKQKTEAFSHLLKLPNKAAENNLGLSLVDIRVSPTNPFSPHANPILGTNGSMNTIGVGEPTTYQISAQCQSYENV